MTSGREITPPPSFPAVPIITTMFAATTHENTPMAYRASTSANPNPVISLAFIEANYEALKSLLRYWHRQMRNNDLLTKLEYFSEDYDEEREMEPRSEPTRAATPPLRIASPRICRFEERTMRFEGAQSRGQTHLGRGKNGKPLQSFLTFSYGGQALPNSIGWNLPSNGVVLNPVGSVTPFVRWIEDYPLPDRLKIHSHIGSYDGKGDPNNFLHPFEGAIRMQKWLMLVAYHMFTYTLKDSARIWWNSLKAGRKVNRAYLDGGSSCEVIYEHCFLKLKPSIGSLRVDSNTPLFGFSGEQSWPLRETPLEVTIGEGLITVMKTLTFVIIKSDSPHNLLLGRTAMQQMGIVVSIAHGAIKFHTPKEKRPRLHRYRRKDGDKRQVPITEDYNRKTTTNKNKNKAARSLKKIHRCLRIDLGPHNGSTKSINDWRGTFNTKHRINMFNHAEPVKQKKRSLAPERNEAIYNQVEELIEARILREVKYQTWVSNPMVVRKDYEKWKLHVDFTNINKACIREPHPLPAAEQKAEGLHKYRLKCFLDAYKGVEKEIYSGHLITKQGIRAYPSKVKAVSPLRPPKMVKEMQNLNKKIVALSGKTVQWTSGMTLPFLKTLKSCASGRMVQWTKEADEAFSRMKGCLESLPTMVIPTKGETLTMYLTTSEENKTGEQRTKKSNEKNQNQKTHKNYSLMEHQALMAQEQEALLAGLCIAKKMEIRELIIFVDSRVEKEIYSGHLITKQGIRAYPSKVKAVSPLRPPKTVKEMQNLNKKIASLSGKTVQWTSGMTLPFLKTLKSCASGRMAQWTKEADEAFSRMKGCLESLPTMVIPAKGETLTMYLATSEENVSAVLMAERGKKQIPVYFISRTLYGAELKYLELEKLILALV
nr:hypothetical protein [Tanacetum cinerariifolium]